MFHKNAINWFEIPVNDLERAQSFYEVIFAMKLLPMDMPGLQMRAFPIDEMTGTGGALVYAPEFNQPSAQGTIVYLNGNPDLQTVFDRVEAAGGTIVMPKTLIDSKIGFMAVMMDTEGNRVALHSGPQA